MLFTENAVSAVAFTDGRKRKRDNKAGKVRSRREREKGKLEEMHGLALIHTLSLLQWLFSVMATFGKCSRVQVGSSFGFYLF